MILRLIRFMRVAEAHRVAGSRRAQFFVSLSALAFAGCASTQPYNYEAIRQDLPLILNRTEGVTELLDGTVVGSEIVSVGDGGTILYSTDSAKTWQKSDVPVQSTLTGVSFASDTQHGWAVGHAALILASTDGGLKWQKQWEGANQAAWFLAVCALDEHRVIAVGTNGLYVETSDGGATWTQRKVVDRDFHLNRISRGPSGTLYIAGEHGTALRSTDNGVTWDRLPLPGDKTLYGILPLGRRSLLAYGGSMSGEIYRSNDDGQTWSAIILARKLLLKTAMIMSDGSILLAGTSGDWRNDPFHGFFLSRDGGHSFEPWKLAAPSVNLIELLQAPDGSFVAFGPEGATILGPK
jgi:photosystem II stability/assembly factor-like uncharacterized protein